MFDNTELKTLGMPSATVQHPLSGKRRWMDFYVAETHKRAILGIEACLEMDIVYVNCDNICAIHEECGTGSSSAHIKSTLTHRSPQYGHRCRRLHR
jgi:hypothetical protein